MNPAAKPESREIACSNGKAIVVDAEDFHFLSKFRWHQIGDYPSTWGKKLEPSYNRACVPIHEFLLRSNDPDIEVDHVNQNPFDNRKSNLRLASRMENAANRRKSKNQLGDYKGITLDKRSNRWKARIKVNGREKSLGLFDNPKDAAMLYDFAAKRFFGEFAFLNFPNETISIESVDPIHRHKFERIAA